VGASAGVVERSENLFEALERLHTLAEAKEILEGVLTGKYPVFAEEITGTFNSEPYQYKSRTTLDVKVTSQEFPDYSLTIARNGSALPWSAKASPSSITTVNPFSANPGGLVTSTAEEPKDDYASGEEAVSEIVSQTKELKAVDANLFATGEVTLVPQPEDSKTISWTFNDLKA
jgi:hypothetical protein